MMFAQLIQHHVCVCKGTLSVRELHRVCISARMHWHQNLAACELFPNTESFRKTEILI